ncbi:hypothetical protein [Candidatus Magnetominusculus xianensis]|nr:hypothetical protein [Candidatus Magnetominusculus xianensis]MBF0403621.1 hypothetical protein [Nitrospirota bacterium]
MAVTVWAAFFLIGICLFYKKGLHAREILYFLLPVILTVLSYGAYLFFNNAFAGFKSDVVDFIMASLKGESTFIKVLSGFDNPQRSILSILKSSALQIATLLVLISTAKAIRNCNNNLFLKLILYSIMAGLTVLLGQMLYKYNGYNQLKILFLIFIGGIISYFYKFIHAEIYKKDYLILLTLFLVSFTLTVRILLNYVPSSYGFYLLPMGLICYYIFFFKTFPSICEQLFNFKNIDYHSYYISVIILIVQTSLSFYSISHACYQIRTLRLDTNYGALYFFDNNRTMKITLLYQYLRVSTPPQSTLVVFPEGVSVNLLAQRDNPLRYYTFVPPELNMISEDKMIGLLKDEKIDYIVITNDSMQIFGYSNFQSYAKDLYKWIIANYTLDAVIASPQGNAAPPFILEKPPLPLNMPELPEQIEKTIQQRYKPTEFIALVFRRH